MLINKLIREACHPSLSAIAAPSTLRSVDALRLFMKPPTDLFDQLDKPAKRSGLTRSAYGCDLPATAEARWGSKQCGWWSRAPWDAQKSGC